MDKKFMEVLAHEGPVTIVTVNAQPAHIVSTWMSYVMVSENQLFIPAAGMHSIEQDFATDNHVVLTFGSKEVMGTVGPGAGFYVSGSGSFTDCGERFDRMKDQFPWLSRVLTIDIDNIEQKI